MHKTSLIAVLAFVGSIDLFAQDPWRRTNSNAAGEHERRIQDMRERGEQIRQRIADGYREEQERRLRERREELERSQAEARANVERLRYGYGTYLPNYGAYRVPQITSVRGNYYRQSGYSSYFSRASDECYEEAKDAQRRQQEEEEGFAAASGKCGDVTTQKIGSFYYHSNGGVTQRIGSFFYGPDGQVTQKIGNFYYHSDGTTTQRIGNFYYDSDGGVTQKIGNFYYHSGGKPCESEGHE